MSEISIDCECENFKGQGSQAFGFRLNLSLNKEAVSDQVKERTQDAAEDLLRIKFNHSRPVPEEVKEYVASNLGVFDLTENGTEKIFVFELKINDINLALIQTVFEKFFAPTAINANMSLTYSRTQSLEEWFQDLKDNTDVPFLLHVLENSRLKLEGRDVNCLIGGLLKYVNSENPSLFQPWMNFLLTLASLRFKGTMRSFKALPKMAFRQMEFEQSDNIKDFFFPFDNPINNYVFEADQPGNLQITGRILNILNYEFEANFPNLQPFVEKVMNM